MPRPGHLWCHVIINTKNTWLHGDDRGFRSRIRDIQSTGDYKNPPPPEEYRKLREHFERVAGDEVHIDRELRPIMGRAILTYLNEQGFRVLAIAVAKVHAHTVVELPHARATVKRIVGEVKRKSSRAAKKQLPGSVWAAGGELKIVADKDHLENAVDYVIYDQGSEAWTWCFRDVSEDGMFGRKRPPSKKRKTR